MLPTINIVPLITRVYGKEQAEVFTLNQALLPQEERMCLGSPCMVHDTRYGVCFCTLERGHESHHIAHDLNGNIVQRWL